MILNKISCEAISVNTETGICPGMAKTVKGETHIIGARTPESQGICCQAFTSLSPMKLAMMYTDKMEWEKNDYFDITCPHGMVVFRLSRVQENENKFTS
jgi:uncharacterized repeat protein (TIGR04076 family)